MLVKGKNHMQGIDTVADHAMQLIQAMHDAPEDLEEVAVDVETLEQLCFGYIHLYTLLMEARQMPVPTDKRKFHTVYH